MTLVIRPVVHRSFARPAAEKELNAQKKDFTTEASEVSVSDSYDSLRLISDAGDVFEAYDKLS